LPARSPRPLWRAREHFFRPRGGSASSPTARSHPLRSRMTSLRSGDLNLRRDGLAEELAEPRLPLLFFDGRVGEARRVSSPSVLHCALLVLRAVGVLLIRHVAMQVCVRWSMRRCWHRAMGGSCWAEACGPQWRMICAVTRRCGSNTQPAPISFSERVLLCKQVERRKGKTGGGLTAGGASTHLLRRTCPGSSSCACA